jgi:enoyl-CoA hydratase/carnithine racemase
VYRLTLARPERRNALSEALVEDLCAELEAIGADQGARVVVLGAEGPVFCSGHDLSEMTDRSAEDYERLFARCAAMMLRLRRLPVPVIARVQGPALAAGCQLVATCDLAIAAEGATFSTPGVRIDLFCTTPMVPLVRAVPPRAAFEMLVTGAPITAERAFEIGLVNRVVGASDLDRAVDDLVNGIVASSPAVIRLGKAAFVSSFADEDEAYRRAVATMVENSLMPDAQEGIGAFLEKRPPVWPGV